MSKVPILDLQPEIQAHKAAFLKAFEDVLDSGQFIMGPKVQSFEKDAAAYLGNVHALGCNSGTDALVLGLRAAGVGPGDEVITTPFTFFATAESISLLGAKPVFIDIEPDTYNMRVDLIEGAITDKTKAIVPVHIFGHAVDMDPVMEIAKKHNLAVVEDVAQAFGGSYKGKKLGSIGTVGAYSFFPSKNLGGFGDGGLVTTDDDKIAEEVGMLRKHGAKKKYYNELLGYNSRLDAVQAAMLALKLPKIDESNAGRRRVAAKYFEAFAEVEGIEAPITKDYAEHVFHQYTVRSTKKDRDAMIEGLKAEGIQTMVYYPVPCHKLPIYDGQYEAVPEAEKAAAQVFSLPIWPTMDDATQNRVIDAVKKVVSS